MRILGRYVLPVGLMAFGYILGVMHGPAAHDLFAQNEPTDEQKELGEKVKAARDAANASMLALQKSNAYVPAIEGLNSFAATTGGIDAIQDLKSGRGVDPETFAGLYAGLAVSDVASKLTRDSEGRLLYEEKLVRMYPISRIKQLFQARVAAPETNDAPKAPGKEKADEGAAAE
jgi:hypothetical protein